VNFTVIRQRWPKLYELLQRIPETGLVSLPERNLSGPVTVNSILLESAFNREREARIQAGLIPTDAQSAWIYGLGLGTLAGILLQRKRLHHLTIVLLNPAIARHVLEHVPMPWLDDPRVTLSLGSSQNQVHAPFAALPGCLRLADPSCARLRDMICLELSTPYQAQKHEKAHHNRLAERIHRNRELFRKDPEAGELFGSAPGRTFIVAGAGPTLLRHPDLLNELRGTSILIAVDAALRPLLEHGIYPDFTVTIDPDDSLYTFFDTGLDMLKDKGLVYFPTVHEKILRKWPGKRFVARPDTTSQFPTATDTVTTPLFSRGSVIHPAVDLAVGMGAAEIYFFGADFSYPLARTHVEGSPAATGFSRDYTPHTVINGYGKSVATTPNLCGYLRDLEQYISTHKSVRWYNTSRQGARIEGCLLAGTGNNTSDTP